MHKIRKLLLTSEVIADAVHLACRAPSYHNSQPWRWIAGNSGIDLFVDPDRVVDTDHSGRQALISCGAVLDHFRVSVAAAGWTANIERFPDPNNPHHVAFVDFTRMPYVTDVHHERAHAITSRRTDRLPFWAPVDWAGFEPLLHAAVGEDVALLDVIKDENRAELADASQLTEALRLYDSPYHAALGWWTKPFAGSDGIPYSSLVSAAESDRVDIGRTFPVTHQRERRVNLIEDQAKVLVISARDQSRRDVLACGEALSAVLLEATMNGMATCTLTHMTEVDASRHIVSLLTGRSLPQVLVRVGIVPAAEEVPPPTPRRPLSDVLQFRTE